MVTVAELFQKQKEPELLDAEEDNEISTITSVLAGIGSGLFKIPEGLFSLGAALMDLGGDTNRVAEVEKYFAEINPFEGMAEATTAGKITELITNLAVPGGIAWKAGSGLAKSAILARKSGKYLDLSGQAGKNIGKGIQNTLKAQKNATKHLGVDRAMELGAGAMAGGVAEGIFVGNVEDAGTFGDLIGGPTKLDRQSEGDAYDPAQEIINRIKFGTEGALFTGALSGEHGDGIVRGVWTEKMLGSTLYQAFKDLKNTFDPEYAGTRISKTRSKINEKAIGISSFKNVALIRVQGAGMVGTKGLIGRIFSSLAEKGINVILVSQAFSEHSVCFSIQPSDIKTAVET